MSIDPITKQTILPCPFCGSEASVEEISGALSDVGFSVGCDSSVASDCYGYQSMTTFARRSDAIDAWNRRPPRQEVTVTYAVVEDKP